MAVLGVVVASVWNHMQGRGSGSVVALRGDYLQPPLWNGSFPLVMAPRPVPQVQFNQSDQEFFPRLMEGYQPFLVKGAPVLKWPAMSRWRHADYFASLFPSPVKVHTPSQPVVRIHHANQPFEAFANWTRPFTEKEVNNLAEIMTRGDMLVYAMFDAKDAFPMLGREVFSQDVTIPWLRALETNVWIAGTSGISTPCHFDMVHNVYSQIVGFKRFVLFPPAEFFGLYTFTRLHPSARQTQIDFLKNSSYWAEWFPRFSTKMAMEVVLGPGDVLYIPPFTFHHVSAVSPPGSLSTNATSISVSVHTTSGEVDVRSSMIEQSLALPVPTHWTRNQRICALRAHFHGLFASAAEGKAFLRQLLSSSFSHFHLDEENARGLAERVREARIRFPKDLACPSLNEPEYQTFVDRGVLVRKTAQGAHSMDIAAILLSDYVQDVVDLVLLGDAPSVDPYLRWMVQDGWDDLA